jgi:alkanesulfonate monooxygenase SsuD/methylene tetrahydromethanopterin reductase-like flavin-dependent oxidoreductase (luciferase family)
VRLGAVLSPVAEVRAVLHAARAADELGFDSVGLWGHYHSAEPDWAYVSGWSAYGAIAAATRRVRLVPMVLNNLHYQPGVLAKESALLANLSGGRFELGIGAGDWPESYAAWGEPYPDAAMRVARLAETLAALGQLWRGEKVSLHGDHVRLEGACSTPAPVEPLRIVVGVGHSVVTASATLAYADEFNVYASERVVAAVAELIADSGRDVAISLFLAWEWDKWPADPVRELRRWQDRGIERVMVSLGAEDIPARMDQLAPLLGG